jgi:co-chaperonin GroES (HSP10)
MIQLPVNLRLIGKRKVAMVPSQRATETESGIQLALINTKHEYKRCIVIQVTDDITDIRVGDEVLANWSKSKTGTLKGWSEELRSSYDIMVHLLDEDDILAIYED